MGTWEHDSDISYKPENDSLFTKTVNLVFKLIVENLNTWKSGINKTVSEGQIKVLTMKTVIFNLQVVVSNISNSVEETHTLTEVQSRL